MYWNGRPSVAEFKADELLYFRYGLDEFIDGRLVSAAIHFPRVSVNRSTLSEPQDVLFDENGAYRGLGVIEFRVSDVPNEIDGENNSAFVFTINHVPEELNYSHSEVWSTRAPGSSELKEPSKSVKLKFRIALSGKARISIVAVRNRR